MTCWGDARPWRELQRRDHPRGADGEDASLTRDLANAVNFASRANAAHIVIFVFVIFQFLAASRRAFQAP